MISHTKMPILSKLAIAGLFVAGTLAQAGTNITQSNNVTQSANMTQFGNGMQGANITSSNNFTQGTNITLSNNATQSTNITLSKNATQSTNVTISKNVTQSTNSTSKSTHMIPDVLMANNLTLIGQLAKSHPEWNYSSVVLVAATDKTITAKYGRTNLSTIDPGYQGFSFLNATMNPKTHYYVMSSANPPYVWQNTSSKVQIRWGTGQSSASVKSASNGKVYAITSIIQPPKNISTTLAANVGATNSSGISTQSFLAALQQYSMTGSQATGSLDLLEGTTIFVPSDDAMSKAAATWASLTDAQKRYVLQYHVVSTTVQYSTTLKTTNFFSTLASGSTLTVTYNNSTVSINSQASIVLPDCFHSNGIAHVIDQLLIPTPLPGATASPTASSVPSAVASTTGSSSSSSSGSSSSGSTSSSGTSGSSSSSAGSGASLSSGVNEKMTMSAFGLVLAMLLAILAL